MPRYYQDLALLTTGHAGTQQDPWSYLDYIASLISDLIQDNDEVLLKGLRHETLKSPFPLGKKIKWDSWEKEPWRLFIDTIDGNSFEGIALKNGLIHSVREDSPLVLGGDLIGDISNIIVFHSSSSQKLKIIRKSEFSILGGYIITDNDYQIEDYITPRLDIEDTAIAARSIINKQFNSVNFSAGLGGFVSGNSNQTIEHGQDTSEVAALPEVGYVFDGWSGDIESEDNPLIVTSITENMQILANFILA